MAIAGYTSRSRKRLCLRSGRIPFSGRATGICYKSSSRIWCTGEDILNSGFNFDVEIRIGAGAFVCGEETALIASVEGKRACLALNLLILLRKDYGETHSD